MTKVKRDWEKKFDKLTSELFSLGSPLHTFKYKEEAMKSFISEAIQDAKREQVEEIKGLYKITRPKKLFDYLDSKLKQLSKENNG